MERLSERLAVIESVPKKLEPVENPFERVAFAGEHHLHDQESSLPFQEAACISAFPRAAVQTISTRRDPALQATRQDALLAKE